MRETATKIPSRSLDSETRRSVLANYARLLRAALDAVWRHVQEENRQGRRAGVALITRCALTPQADYQAYPEAENAQQVRRALAVSEQVDQFVTDTRDDIVDSRVCDAAYYEFFRKIDCHL